MPPKPRKPPRAKKSGNRNLLIAAGAAAAVVVVLVVASLALRGVRVGRATVDLRFERRSDGSASHKVVGRHGSLLVVEAGPPAVANGDRPRIEWLRQAALERVPGRLGRLPRSCGGP